MSVEAFDVYARRRGRVLEALGAEGALVLPAAPELRAGRDLDFRYRPDPDLHYLTGYPEPDAVAVLAPGHTEAPLTFFVRPRDAKEELWTGARGGPEAATGRYGANAAFPLAELEARLPEVLAGVDTVYFPLGSGRDAVEALVLRIVAGARRRAQRSGRGPRTLADPGRLLDEMRLVKEPGELALLREAARLTVAGFRDAARVIRPGAGEWEVEAALEHGFRARGADGIGFASIVAAGANATVLHYIENGCRIEEGDLVLVDAGARCGMYNGDISRTFPASGRFTTLQRELYDTVLRARDRAIAAVRPGATVTGIHAEAVRALVEGLLGLGLLEGGVDALIEQKKHEPYYPHKTSHWLGLDVHDVGDYAVRGEPRPLVPGMVLTIEPGLYIAAGSAEAPAELRGAGVRIEDDVLVTGDGCEVLTAELPAEAEAVEAMMRSSG